MKKKHFLMMLIISLPLFFTGCVEDMYEDSVSMENLYRQKAAEFSKKYGVDVTIIEQMRLEYKREVRYTIWRFCVRRVICQSEAEEYL